MTLSELKQALAELPQLPSDTEVTIEDDSGELRYITYLDSEQEYEVVVVHIGDRMNK